MTSLNPSHPLPSSKRTTHIVRGRRVRGLLRLIAWSILAAPLAFAFWSDYKMTLEVIGITGGMLAIVASIVFLVVTYDE